MARPVPLTVAFAVACVGIAVFSLMDALMKGLTIEIGVYNALFWRTLASVAIGLPLVLHQRIRPTGAAMRLHVIRGSATSVMALLFFWGLARVPMAQAIALCFIAPLIALYLASVLLGERIKRGVILASLVGFAGVLVIVWGQSSVPHSPDQLLGTVAILISAGIYAYNIILMRQQAKEAGPLEIAFFTSLIMVSWYLLAAPFLAVWPDAAHWPSLGGAAMLAYVSLLCLGWAYARAEAQYLAPVEYTGFIWAALFGFLFFSEPVAVQTLVGAAMIIAACFMATRSAVRPDPEKGMI